MILHMKDTKLPPKAEFVPNYKLLFYSEEKTIWKCIPIYLACDKYGDLQIVTEDDINLGYYYDMELILDHSDNLLYHIDLKKKFVVMDDNYQTDKSVIYLKEFGWIRELDCDCDTQLNHFKSEGFIKAYKQIEKTIKSINNLGLKDNTLIDNAVATLDLFSKSILDDVMIANVLKEKYCVNCIPLK